MTGVQPAPTTTDAGIPIESDEHSLTIGPDGPILLHDHYLIEQLAQFNRERVPERQPHAKGSGAFGRFEVTQDVSAFTKAAVFQPGTTTETVIRFSTVAGERGSPDTWRDPRGFALKFYTTEGNYDIVGNDTPVFFLRDPLKFPSFIRSQKRRADNNLRDHDMQWDFWTLSPESAHQVTWLMGDRGIPASWRHMNLYSGHTFMWVNAAGEKVWVRYHFITDQGIENLTQAEADALVSVDTDYHTRDLFEAIQRGDHPSWTLKMQIMPFADAKTYRFNPFDLTKVWPHADYPLIEVGRLTLDHNPTDNHSQIEQGAWSPSNLVPASARAPTRCCWAGCSPTPTRSVTASARTTTSCRSTPPSHQCTATARTDRCAITPSPTRCIRRIPRADLALTPNATASPPAGTPTGRWCAPPTRCAPRTTTGAKPAPLSVT
jgi:catalase